MPDIEVPLALSAAAKRAYGMWQCMYEFLQWWTAWVRRSKWILGCCVCAGLWADLFLYGFTIPLFPYMIEDRIALPHQEAQFVTSNLLAIFAGSQLMFAPVIRAVVERTEKKKPVVVWALVCGLVAMWGLSWTVHVWALYVARLVQGICSTVVWSVGLAVIAETVGHHNMGHVMGFATTFMNSGSFCGPMIGGWLLKAVGYADIWQVAYGILLADILVRLFLAETQPNIDQLFDELGYDGNQFSVPIGSRRVPRRPQRYGTIATHRRCQVYDAALMSPVSESSSSSFSSVTSEQTITHESTVAVVLDHHNREFYYGTGGLYTGIPNVGSSSASSNTYGQDEGRRPLLHTVTSIVAAPMPISTLDLYKTLFGRPCFLASMVSIFVYAVLVSSFDATMPLFAKQAFEYDSWDSGSLLMGLQIPSMFLGFFQVRLRDRWGVGWPATVGFAFVAPLLVVTGSPGSGYLSGLTLAQQEALFRMCLLLIGSLLAISTNSGMVECTAILEDVKESYPNMFGRAEEGVDFSGYSRLYSICTMVYTLGTLVGALLSGLLVNRAGYLIMNCVLVVATIAVLSVIAACTSYLFILKRKVKPYHRREYVQGVKVGFFDGFDWIRRLVYRR